MDLPLYKKPIEYFLFNNLLIYSILGEIRLPETELSTEA